MADPIKSKPTPVVEPPVLEPSGPIPVMPPQSSEAQAIQDRQAFTAQNPSARGVTILPGGQRRTVSSFVGARYSMNKQAKLLGNPESMLTDDWLSAHRGWHYAWPVSDADETRMYLKNGMYKAVPPEAVRKDIDFAVVGDTLTVQGSAVSWKRHVLVAVPYEVWYDQNVAPADYAMERTATGQDFKDELDSRFGGAGYRAEVTAFTDQRTERF